MNCFRKDCENKSIDYKVCAQCFKTFYCSDECLESDWFSRHESECEGHKFNLKDFTSSSSILGSGAYSQVKLFKHKPSSELYAIKIIKKSIISVVLPLSSLFREISIHKSLIHDHIVRLFDQLEDDKRIYLILEYAGSSTLLDLLKKKQVLTEPQAARVLVELCLALRYMHEKGIMHRDLKPENILMTVTGKVKICDLGWSVFCERPRNTYCGSLDYMAPEVFEGVPYSYPADVWSLGIVLLEMMQGVNPFVLCTEEEKVEKIKKKNWEIDDNITKSCRDLIRKILEFKPERRFGISDILRHRWIQENYFFPNDLDAGVTIFHNDFGQGIVSFVKGMMCTVDFPGFSLDFAIPELVKISKVLKESSVTISDSFKSEIGQVVSSFNSSNDSSAESWKVQDSLTMNESSTLTGEPFALDLTEVPEKSFFSVKEKKNELQQLQFLLESPQVIRKSNRTMRKSLMEKLFD
jgi:serine/threonine protein kinase